MQFSPTSRHHKEYERVSFAMFYLRLFTSRCLEWLRKRTTNPELLLVLVAFEADNFLASKPLMPYIVFLLCNEQWSVLSIDCSII
jgi:hypothetical protein